MGFIDSLTSEQARTDARDIKAQTANQNLSGADSYYELLLEQLDNISYDRLSEFTLIRKHYEMNRMMRKRNGVWKALKELNAKQGDATIFYKYFSGSDPELVDRIRRAQDIMNSINNIYYNIKYRTRENVFVQSSVASVIQQTETISKELTDFKEYYLEKP